MFVASLNDIVWTFRAANVKSHGWEMVKVKVKWSSYRPGVAQRVGRGITLLFHDRCTRRGWVVSSTPRPHLTPGKDRVLILQEAGWAPGSVLCRAENLVPTGIRSRTVQPAVSRYTDWATGPSWNWLVEGGGGCDAAALYITHRTVYPINTFLSNQQPTVFQDCIGLKF